jgi:hypothetical protein
MTIFKETHEVEFDGDGFAVHRTCGARLTEDWSIARTESYGIKRDGTLEMLSEGGDDKDCEGVWCGYCDARVTLEKAE